MRLRKLIIPLAVLLFGGLDSAAQDNTYVYKDSALLYEDSVLAKPVEVAPSEDGEEGYESEYIVDTVLRNNQLSIEDDSVQALKNARSFSYAKNLDSLLNAYQQEMAVKEQNPGDNTSWLERILLSGFTFYFFWSLAIFFVVFIVYKLFFTKGFFQRAYTRSGVEDLTDETEKLSSTADYAKLAAQAVAAGNYRVAVRYLYLQSLQKLTAKGILQFAADKTNYQYVQELSGKAYKNTFATLTLHYEYVWYGGFEIDENLFNVIESKFKQFNREI